MFNITVRNTHFVVTLTTRRKYLRALQMFNAALVTYKQVYIPKLKRMNSVEDKQFYYRLTDMSYSYSINLLLTFIKRMYSLGYSKRVFNISYDRDYDTNKLDVYMKEHLSDKDFQTAYIKKVLSTKPVVLVDLKTGKGKTYISMRAVTSIGDYVGIVVLSRYIEKWIGDVLFLTTATREDIFVVQGRDTLIKLLESNKKYKFVIFSLSTLRSYAKYVDVTPGMSYRLQPERVFASLGIGAVVVDEVHQSFHAGYMCLLRYNPKRIIGLSATLDSLDDEVVRMYNTLYTKEARCGDIVVFQPHPIVIAVAYKLRDPERISCMGPRGYSHTVYEQNIMRNSALRYDYIKMLEYYVTNSFVRRYKEGDKMLILVQTVKMATMLSKYLDDRLGDLKVNRYVEEDPYENIMEGDITVSTNLSAGTALDIEGLVVTLQTVSIRSLQANIQALGRLREMKGRDVTYYYVHCRNLTAHRKLDIVRRQTLKPLAKEYRQLEYYNVLRCT